MKTNEFKYKVKALRVLENEHHYIRHLMNEWFQFVLKFENEDVYSRLEGMMAIKEIREKLKAFRVPLKKHQEKEEKYFFPMLGVYIGYEQGPILSIEEEHEEIDAYIDHFLHHSEQVSTEMDISTMHDMVKDVMEAYEVLMVHMVKEEAVLFDMAEKMLKQIDEEVLLEQVNTLIVE